MADERFSIIDYVVFSVMLLISALIGIWYGCGPGGKQKTTAEYLLGDRQMKNWPVAISLLVSYLSAITLLGVPSEIYTYGGQYYVLIISYFIICFTVAVIFVPMFRRVNITCANEVSLQKEARSARDYAAGSCSERVSVSDQVTNPMQFLKEDLSSGFTEIAGHRLSRKVISRGNCIKQHVCIQTEAEKALNRCPQQDRIRASARVFAEILTCKIQ